MSDTVNVILLLICISFVVDMHKAQQEKRVGWYWLSALVAGICAAAFVDRLTP
jgi:hypothetical protein